jgi:hypothetical protein
MTGLPFDRMEEIANLKNYQLRESARQASANKTVRKSKSKGMYFEVNNVTTS